MRLITAVFLIILIASVAWAQADDRQIVINGKTLDAGEMETVRALERQFHVQVVPGRYWYDPRSGLYGAEGQGAFGQTVPNLPLGGKLREDASNGDTAVWVNGRRLHRTDVAYLQQCTQVIPGRYWLDPAGYSGVEGGPPQWNVAQLCSAARQRSSSYRGKYGSVLSDGATTGAMFRTSSGDIVGVTCGPDGGCIY
jgi:hypothetical protein